MIVLTLVLGIYSSKNFCVQTAQAFLQGDSAAKNYDCAFGMGGWAIIFAIFGVPSFLITYLIYSLIQKKK